MSILEELWNGQLYPGKNVHFRDGEYQELAALLEKNKEKLLPELNREQQEKLMNMEGIWEEMEYITGCGSFIMGFRLAVQLMSA